MTNSEHILIVDDEPELLFLYKKKLELAGFIVSTAKDGVIALGMLKIEQPDLMLLDVKMPVMDGVTTLKNIRSNPLTKDVKVIMFSAFNDLHMYADPEKDNAVLGVIKKGEDLNTLVEQVKNFMSSK